MNGKQTKDGSLSTCFVLACVLLVGSSTHGSTIIAAVVVPVAVTLLANELDRSGGLIATRLAALAARLLPRPHRDDARDEWVDHVLCAGEAGVRPVMEALKIGLISAPLLAIRLRAFPLAGMYLLNLLVVVADIWRARPGQISRKSTISLALAVLRLPSIVIAPMLALCMMLMRRPVRTPRWAFYAAGGAIAISCNYIAPGWLGGLAEFSLTITVMSVALAFLAKQQAVLQLSRRLLKEPNVEARLQEAYPDLEIGRWP